MAPPWERGDPNGKILISIEPNMAFGTGTHETTQLCLKAIGDHYQPEQTMLDVGTGTGILAIAAAKVGGASIRACDTDEESVKIAIENAKLNGVSSQIEFFHGSIDQYAAKFDWVCANLTLDVFEKALGQLLSKTSQTLMLSGILAEQKPMIVSELQKIGLSDALIIAKGEWISVKIDLN